MLKFACMKLTCDELLLKYFEVQPPHPYEVKRLCRMLFCELSKNVFEMPRRELDYLEAAAVLHDIGYAVEDSTKSHNKISRDIILAEGPKGFTDEEVKIIACIARYHRGSLPDKNEHKLYGSFSKPERNIIKRLSGILRFADGLDGEHKPLIDKIQIENDRENNIIKINLYKKEGVKGLDITKSLRKRDLLEIGFKCQSVVFIKSEPKN